MKRAILFLACLCLCPVAQAEIPGDFTLVRDIDRIGEQWAQRRRERYYQVDAQAWAVDYAHWRNMQAIQFRSWYDSTFGQRATAGRSRRSHRR